MDVKVNSTSSVAELTFLALLPLLGALHHGVDQKKFENYSFCVKMPLGPFSVTDS
jgi:hypothetical protein